MHATPLEPAADYTHFPGRNEDHIGISDVGRERPGALADGPKVALLNAGRSASLLRKRTVPPPLTVRPFMPQPRKPRSSHAPDASSEADAASQARRFTIRQPLAGFCRAPVARSHAEGCHRHSCSLLDVRQLACAWMKNPSPGASRFRRDGEGWREPRARSSRPRRRPPPRSRRARLRGRLPLPTARSLPGWLARVPLRPCGRRREPGPRVEPPEPKSTTRTPPSGS